MMHQAVYCAGVIGFVGLVIPHVIRILFGTDHRRLLPLSALLGASFLIWCDVACRVILKNSEMPIGVLVSIIGAPSSALNGNNLLWSVPKRILIT